MCPLCLTTLAVTVTATTGAGAAAAALVTRAAKAIVRSPEAAPPAPADRAEDKGGAR